MILKFIQMWNLNFVIYILNYSHKDFKVGCWDICTLKIVYNCMM